MTSPNIPVLCSICSNVIGFNKGTLTCRAFKEGIPDDILSNQFDHRFEHDGDNGILFDISGDTSKLNATKSKESLKNIVQDTFENTIKLNYRCPKGKFVPDSFECGKTEKEAKANYKAYQKEKKDAIKQKKIVAKEKQVTKKAYESAKKAKKGIKTIENAEHKKAVSDLVKKVEEEKKAGNVSKETFKALKDAIKNSKTTPTKETAEINVKNIVLDFGDINFIPKYAPPVMTMKESYMKNFSDDEKDAISMYRGIFAENINKYLSGSIDEISREEKNAIDNIKNGLRKVNTPEDIVVYRGIRNSTWNRFEKNGMLDAGKLVKYAPFMSTSYDKKTYEKFSNRDANGKLLRMELRLPKGTNAAFVSSDGPNQDESEILVDSGYKFEVVGVKEDDTYKTVVWKIIGRSDIEKNPSKNNVKLPKSKLTVREGSFYKRYDDNSILRIDKIENEHVYFSKSIQGIEPNARWTSEFMRTEEFIEFSDEYTSDFSEIPRIKNSMEILDTEMSRAVFNEYTLERYEDINRYLVDSKLVNDPDIIKEDVDVMDEAFKNASYPEDTVVYSGLGTSASRAIFDSVCPNKICEEGRVFEMKPFVSTSLDKTNTWVFNGGGISLKIEVAKGSKAISLESVSSFMDEQEILLNRGSKFQIIGSKMVISTKDTNSKYLQINVRLLNN